MNKQFFECKVKYRKTLESGVQKVVTEVYLVDALTYSEAESVINSVMLEITSEQFRIATIKTTNLSEVHATENSDKWFKAKISLLAYDEESGKEKKTNIYFLIQANNAKESYTRTEEIMKSSMGEYSIPSITESPILEYIPYAN